MRNLLSFVAVLLIGVTAVFASPPLAGLTYVPASWQNETAPAIYLELLDNHNPDANVNLTLLPLGEYDNAYPGSLFFDAASNSFYLAGDEEDSSNGSSSTSFYVAAVSKGELGIWAASKISIPSVFLALAGDASTGEYFALSLDIAESTTLNLFSLNFSRGVAENLWAVETDFYVPHFGVATYSAADSLIYFPGEDYNGTDKLFSINTKNFAFEEVVLSPVITALAADPKTGLLYAVAANEEENGGFDGSTVVLLDPLTGTVSKNVTDLGKSVGFGLALSPDSGTLYVSANNYDGENPSNSVLFTVDTASGDSTRVEESVLILAFGSYDGAQV